MKRPLAHLGASTFNEVAQKLPGGLEIRLHYKLKKQSKLIGKRNFEVKKALYALNLALERSYLIKSYVCLNIGHSCLEWGTVESNKHIFSEY